MRVEAKEYNDVGGAHCAGQLRGVWGGHGRDLWNQATSLARLAVGAGQLVPPAMPALLRGPRAAVGRARAEGVLRAAGK